MPAKQRLNRADIDAHFVPPRVIELAPKSHLRSSMEMDALDTDMRDRLWATEIYDVDVYGWKNEEEEDPDYIGYTMWTLNAPYEHSSVERQDGRPPERRATKEQQRLIELGEDFHGVMK